MAKSSKPRKRYSHRKENDRLALNAAHGSFLMTVDGLAHKGQVWILNRQQVPNELWSSKAYRKPFDLSFMTPRKWCLTSGVACRNQDGEFYVKYFTQQANNEFIYFDPQIQEWAIQNLADIVQDVNKEHILTSFTIANSSGHQFTQEQILDLMDWLQVNNSTYIQTTYERIGIEQKAREEIADYRFEQHLDPMTCAVLRKHGLLTWFDVHQAANKLKSLKGIGEKRFKTICDTVANLAIAKEFRPTLRHFQDYLLDASRRAVSVEFMENRIKAAQEMYQQYLEGKQNGKYH